MIFEITLNGFFTAFGSLLNLVGKKMCKMDTAMRSSINKQCKINGLGKQFLATGNSYEDLKFEI